MDQLNAGFIARLAFVRFEIRRLAGGPANGAPGQLSVPPPPEATVPEDTFEKEISHIGG